jgi:HlyD family secretion protein
LTAQNRGYARLLWIVAGAVVIIGLAIVLGSNIQRSSAEATPDRPVPNVRSWTVGRGDLEEIVRSPGEVVAARTTNLPIAASGIVSEVLVKTGNVVTAGQVLVKLDTRELQAQLEAAIAAQRSAQARLDGVQNAPARELAELQRDLKIAQTRLEGLRTPNAKPEELQAAQAAVDAAVARYNALLSRPNQKDVAAAEANLRATKAKLEALRQGPTDIAVREANSRIEQAQQNLEKVKAQEDDKVKQADTNQKKAQNSFNAAKTAYDEFRKTKYNGNVPITPLTADEQAKERELKLALDQAELELQAATTSLESARTAQIAAVKEAEGKVIEQQVALEKLQAGRSQQELLSAQAEVDAAQAIYDRVAQGPTRDELSAAQSEINEAKAYLDSLNKGASDKEIQLAQLEVEKVQAKIADLNQGPLPADLSKARGDLDAATATVKQIQLKLEQAQLTAPYNAVVENVLVAPGQSVAPGPALINLIDLSSLAFRARVNEVNVQRVTSGLPVRIYFERITSVPDKPFKGTVKFISYRPEVGPPVGPVVTSTGQTLPNYGYPVDIALDPDKDLQTLKPGMTGRTLFVLQRKTNVLLLPKAVLRSIDGGYVVDIILNNGQIVTTPIVVGLENDNFVEVIETGLVLEGDKLVLHGKDPAPALPSPVMTGTVTPVITGTVTPEITGTVTAGITGTVTPAITGTTTAGITATTTVSGTVSAAPGVTATTAASLTATVQISPTPILTATLPPNVVPGTVTVGATTVPPSPTPTVPTTPTLPPSLPPTNTRPGGQGTVASR